MEYTLANLTQSFFSEYIHGDRFAGLADWVFNDDASMHDCRFGGHDGVVFCCTHYVEKIFDVMRAQPHRFVLITHNSDWNITEELYGKRPANLVHWFAQNVLIDKPDLTPIPIGLERQGLAKDRDVASSMQAQMLAGRPEKQSWCYLNISPSTNDAERLHVLRRLRWRIHFVTLRTRRVPYETYVKEMASHRFIVSPPGNGVDCHRTWESLYLGSTPIVKESACMRAFDPVGLMIVQDISRITKRQLHNYLSENHNKPDLRLLFFSYWSDLILDVVQRVLPGRRV